jgi:ABC-2 type transport system permease protein
MRLLAAEVKRFWARRAIAVVLLLTVAAALVLAGTTIWSTRGVTQAEVATAQQQQGLESAATRDAYEACLADPPAQPDDVPAAQRCEDLDPQLDWFLPRQELDLANELESSGLVLALVLAGAAVVVGTTFAGADWHSGAISTQLLFRPGRLRLWGAKAAGVVLGVTLAATPLVAGFWLALGGTAAARGLAVDGALAQEVALHGARSVVLAAACGLGAFALTMAVRSTMVTLAVLFVYTVAGEALWSSLPFTRSSQWLLSSNVQAWVLDGVTLADDGVCSPPGGVCDPTYVLPLEHGAIYLGVLLVIAVAASLLTFPRRDIA